jgi:hypothetical protein
MPMLEIRFEDGAPKASDIANRLRQGTPRIHVDASRAHQGTLLLALANLKSGDTAIIVRRLREAIGGVG